MKNQLDYSKFIERYLDGEMGEQELKWFQKEIEAEASLQKELKLRQKINESIAEEKIFVYRNQLEEAFQTIETEKSTSPRRKLHPALLSSVLAFVIVGTFLTINLLNRSQSNDYLFNKYYQPYEASMTFRSNDASNTELNVAMKKYQNGDFKGALIMFENILKNDPSKIGLNFYSGISQMEEKEYDRAGTSFNKVIQDNYNMYLEQAEWYLALCYMITDKNEKAIVQFDKIVAENGFYSKQAKKVLRKIR